MARQLGAGHTPKPLHSFFVGLGGALLMAALFTDSMYLSNALIQWANFSAWLITGGLVLGLRLNQHQKAMTAARARAEAKLRASLS